MTVLKVKPKTRAALSICPMELAGVRDDFNRLRNIIVGSTNAIDSAPIVIELIDEIAENLDGSYRIEITRSDNGG